MKVMFLRWFVCLSASRLL